jgi:hypothetical protein
MVKISVSDTLFYLGFANGLLVRVKYDNIIDLWNLNCVCSGMTPMILFALMCIK